ncbi:MAG: catechol 2,3-dioxygenase-like lactoylglutathione lyase family enzyme [Halioglobus sp.]|jgi:catechol 2,3-dioxygenase-like lactoylglutathione lyase family enzyme
MLDHIAITVSDLERSRLFYEAALKPLDFNLLMQHDISGAGFGKGMKPQFWIQPGEPSGPIHIAFSSPDRAAVDAFYTAAIAAGASCNGEPGVRSEYHPTYYGAFVKDFDGNNVEAVCHLP